MQQEKLETYISNSSTFIHFISWWNCQCCRCFKSV